MRRVAAMIAAPLLAALLLPPSAAASEPWWVPVAGSLRPGSCVRDHPCLAHRPDGGTVSIRDGRVVETGPAGAPAPLEGPDLGAGATLIAAPAALPGTLVAVAGDGTVWRRASGGSWGRSLLLLPRGLTGGVPAVTSIVAFDQPITPAVYLATDGYSVLISNDGGDDWIRAGAELPDRVFALAADSATRSVYAATSSGLWVHHVRRLPGPPSYADDLLWWRWLGVIGVAAAASAAALAAMWRALAATPSGSAAAPSGDTVAPPGPRIRSRGG